MSRICQTSVTSHFTQPINISSRGVEGVGESRRRRWWEEIDVRLVGGVFFPRVRERVGRGGWKIVGRVNEYFCWEEECLLRFRS